MYAVPAYPFVQAKWYTHGPRHNPIDLVVIHDMEYPEKPDAAEAVAQYFARGSVKASAHYCVDNNSVVQCVRDDDIAWHAPGANHDGIGIEHAGYARQTTGEWLDAYGTAMLRDVSAPLVRTLCVAYGIPKVWLSVADLKAGKRGVTSHNNVSLAFKESTHTDPGPNFPVEQFMAWVIGPPPIPQPEPEDDMLRIVQCREHPTAGEFLTNGIDSMRTLTPEAKTHGVNLGYYPSVPGSNPPVAKVDPVPHDWIVWVDQAQDGHHNPGDV